jgi:hypothetical protein
MKTLSIKDLVVFRGKTEKSKKKFAADVKIDIEKTGSDGGGDYWRICLSAISSAYKLNNLQILKDKTDEFEDKFEDTDYKRTKIMYRRNLDIIYKYEEYDFKKLRPSNEITFLKKPKAGLILTIKGLQVKVDPHHVFSFKRNEIQELGAIWFIATLDGLKKEELGMFVDILHRYLKTQFSKDYSLNPKYCLAIDVVSGLEVNYSQIQKEQIPALLTPTIDEIKRLM